MSVAPVLSLPRRPDAGARLRSWRAAEQAVLVACMAAAALLRVVAVFRYRIDQLEVEDSLQPTATGSGFQRSVTVRGSGEGWYFWGASNAAMPQPLVWHDGTAHFEEGLQPQLDRNAVECLRDNSATGGRRRRERDDLVSITACC